MKFVVLSALALATVSAREPSQAFLNRLGVPEHEVRGWKSLDRPAKLGKSVREEAKRVREEAKRVREEAKRAVSQSITKS